jgi:hypothetical protein
MVYIEEEEETDEIGEVDRNDRVLPFPFVLTQEIDLANYPASNVISTEREHHDDGTLRLILGSPNPNAQFAASSKFDIIQMKLKCIMSTKQMRDR